MFMYENVRMYVWDVSVLEPCAAAPARDKRYFFERVRRGSVPFAY